MTVKDYHYFGCIIKVAEAPLTDEEIDLLLTQLTSEEIEKLLEDTDPDDKHMPPSARLDIHSTIHTYSTYNIHISITSRFI